MYKQEIDHQEEQKDHRATEPQPKPETLKLRIHYVSHEGTEARSNKAAAKDEGGIDVQDDQDIGYYPLYPVYLCH